MKVNAGISNGVHRDNIAPQAEGGLDMKTVVSLAQAAIPVRPPVDMTDAIRRQSRTQGVDYHRFMKKQPASHVTVNRQFVLSNTRDTPAGKEGQIINHENNHGNSNGDKDDITSNSLPSRSFGLSEVNQRLVDSRINGISRVNVTDSSVQTSPRLFKESKRVFHNENINIPTGMGNQEIPSTNNSKTLQRKLPKLSLTHGERISPVLSYHSSPNRYSSLSHNRHVSVFENANQSGLNIEDNGVNKRSSDIRQIEDDAKEETVSPKLNESPLHFADQILKASDLTHMSKLCSEKVPYAEFIEKVEPHRLGYFNAKNVSVNQSKPATNNNSSSTLISSNKQTKMRPANNRKHLPFHSNDTQDLDQHSKEYSSVTMSELPKDETSTSGKPPFSYVLTKDPIQLPEIDYDKPITIIVEANNPSSKLSKPILKTRLNDVRTESNAMTPSYSSPVRPGTEDKGRLVRFRVHPKVHEFAPSEPVKYRPME